MKIAFDSEGFRRDIRTKRLLEMEESLESVSKKVKVSAATLSRCENGKMIPDLLTYAKLCEWLDIPLNKHIKKVR